MLSASPPRLTVSETVLLAVAAIIPSEWTWTAPPAPVLWTVTQNRSVYVNGWLFVAVEENTVAPIVNPPPKLDPSMYRRQSRICELPKAFGAPASPKISISYSDDTWASLARYAKIPDMGWAVMTLP